MRSSPSNAITSPPPSSSSSRQRHCRLRYLIAAGLSCLSFAAFKTLVQVHRKESSSFQELQIKDKSSFLPPPPPISPSIISDDVAVIARTTSSTRQGSVVSRLDDNKTNTTRLQPGNLTEQGSSTTSQKSATTRDKGTTSTVFPIDKPTMNVTSTTTASTSTTGVHPDPPIAPKPFATIQDVICHGCVHQVYKKSKNKYYYCGSLIENLMYPKKKTSIPLPLNEAASTVAQEYPEACGRCHPTTCNDSRQKHYLGYDEAFTTPISKAYTHYLPSVPNEHRFPQDLNSLQDYMAIPTNVYPNKLHLFEYNPSIVILPKRYQERFVASGLVNQPTYLASYRVTHINMCLRTQSRMKLYESYETYQKLPPTDHLGLAVLDANFQILKDVVVSWRSGSNFNSKKRLSEFQSWTSNPNNVDYRLFVLHDVIYLTMGIMIFPIEVTLNNNDGHNQTQEDKMDGYVKFRTVFNSEGGLQEEGKRGGLEVYGRRYASCTKVGTQQQGKNLQYFVDKNNNTVVDFYPSLTYPNPHDVRYVDLNSKCGSLRSDGGGGGGNDDNDDDSPKTSPTNSTTPVGVFRVIPSFGTIEEVKYPSLKQDQKLFTGDRGSACCVEIVAEDGTPYFLAVSHPKTIYPGKKLPAGVSSNSYLSRFYAFEQTPPYRIVAKTGKFCLGYAGDDASHHPIGDLTARQETRDVFSFAGSEYKCPRIHFVTGISDKADDSSKFILAYGVNDCLSRFVEINKQDVVTMLWPAKTALADASISTK